MECSRTPNTLSNSHSFTAVATLEAIMQTAPEMKQLLVNVLEFRIAIKRLNALRMIKLCTVCCRTFSNFIFPLGILDWFLGFLVGWWILLDNNIIITIIWRFLNETQNTSTRFIQIIFLLVILSSIVFALDFTYVADKKMILAVRAHIIYINFLF